MCALGKLKWHLKSADLQKGEVVEYKYFVSVLKYIFLVSVLYSTTYFSDDFLLLFLHFLNVLNRLVTLVLICVWWPDHHYLESLRAY